MKPTNAAPLLLGLVSSSLVLPIRPSSSGQQERAAKSFKRSGGPGSTTATTPSPAESSDSSTSSSNTNNKWGGATYLPPAYVCSTDTSVNPIGCSSTTHDCIANPNHPQATSDDDCSICQSGQTYWPCDVDGLCYCWDRSKAKIPPAPSTRAYNSGVGLQVCTEDTCAELLTEETFSLLAPQAAHPYTYAGFCTAVNEYNNNHPTEGIFNMGSTTQRKSELAAFLGNALHESDEFRAGREYLMCADPIEAGGEVYCRPCDAASFDWTNMTCPTHGSLASQGRAFNGYCQSNLLPPEGCECDDVYERSPNGTMAGYIRADSIYMGRGSIQLSWNYNYIRASVALTGASQTFCQRPDLIATKEEYAWGAGLFYWMENTKNDRTCHQSILLDDDFGSTLDNINGGLECPADDHGWHGTAVQLRLNRYCRAATAVGVDRLSSFNGCLDMDRRMRQCLDEKTCDDCKVWEDTLDLPEEVSDDDGATAMSMSLVGGGKRAKAGKLSDNTEVVDSENESAGRAKSSKQAMDALLSMSMRPDHPNESSSSPTYAVTSNEPTLSISSIASGSSSTMYPTFSITTIAESPGPTSLIANTSGGDINQVIANCNSDVECFATVRSSQPRTQESTSGVELCQCYAASIITPFDECEDDAMCVTAKCTNSCDGLEAYCDIAIHTGDGVRDCMLRPPATNTVVSNISSATETTPTKPNIDDALAVMTTKATSMVTTSIRVPKTKPPTLSFDSSTTPLWKVQELLDNPLPSAASQFAGLKHVVSSSSDQPTAPSSLSSQASQFAMMTHPKQSGQDDPTSTTDCIVFGRCDETDDLPTLTPQKESGQDDTTVDCLVFGRCDKQGDDLIIHLPESLEGMTNWANTPLDHPTAMSSAKVLTDTSNKNDIPISRSNPTAGTTTSTNVAEATYFPVWRKGGTVACVDDISPPSWASGAYLKESKANCCQAYSVLQLDECLAA